MQVHNFNDLNFELFGQIQIEIYKLKHLTDIPIN